MKTQECIDGLKAVELFDSIVPAKGKLVFRKRAK